MLNTIVFFFFCCTYYLYKLHVWQWMLSMIYKLEAKYSQGTEQILTFQTKFPTYYSRIKNVYRCKNSGCEHEMQIWCFCLPEELIARDCNRIPWPRYKKGHGPVRVNRISTIYVKARKQIHKRHTYPSIVRYLSGYLPFPAHSTPWFSSMRTGCSD